MATVAGVKLFFLSDLHLDPSRPELTDIFLRFLADRARSASRIYLLGDIFEAWIGDDGTGDLEDSVAEALNSLNTHGVELYFMAGNRDFLLGEQYASRCSMRRLPDPCVIDLPDGPVLLSHGDLLCTADLPYQAFRAQVRDPRWQAEFLAKSIADRREIAARARLASASHQRDMSAQIADVEPAAVDALLARFGIDRLIHGHTHRPATHRWESGGRAQERWVLSDWRAVGEALEVGSTGFQRHELT